MSRLVSSDKKTVTVNNVEMLRVVPEVKRNMNIIANDVEKYDKVLHSNLNGALIKKTHVGLIPGRNVQTLKGQSTEIVDTAVSIIIQNDNVTAEKKRIIGNQSVPTAIIDQPYKKERGATVQNITTGTKRLSENHLRMKDLSVKKTTSQSLQISPFRQRITPRIKNLILKSELSSQRLLPQTHKASESNQSQIIPSNGHLRLDSPSTSQNVPTGIRYILEDFDSGSSDSEDIKTLPTGESLTKDTENTQYQIIVSRLASFRCPSVHWVSCMAYGNAMWMLWKKDLSGIDRRVIISPDMKLKIFMGDQVVSVPELEKIDFAIEVEQVLVSVAMMFLCESTGNGERIPECAGWLLEKRNKRTGRIIKKCDVCSKVKKVNKSRQMKKLMKQHEKALQMKASYENMLRQNALLEKEVADLELQVQTMKAQCIHNE